MNIYERETTEIVKISVRKDKSLFNTGIYFAILGTEDRPIETDWVNAMTLSDGRCGILITTYDVGIYSIWARAVVPPEDAIWRVGSIRIV